MLLLSINNIDIYIFIDIYINIYLQCMKILCGTEPFPTDYRAKKYKLDRHFIEKVKLSLDATSISL